MGAITAGILRLSPQSDTRVLQYDWNAPGWCDFAMASRTSSLAISRALLLGFSTALYAQLAKAPSLREIVDRLETNLQHYDAGIPSLFCDEHVNSSQTGSDMRDQNTVIDSVFRLKRTPHRDHTTTLVESREIKSVDGKPATSQDMDGPALLSGMFEGGLAVVSLSQAPCMSYTLQRISSDHPAEPYVIRFATFLTPQNSASCFLKENSKGRVFIDPASMQVTHLEITTPGHLIEEASDSASRVVGKREITVDYAPVVLGGETFWMPSAIAMRTTSGSGTFHMTSWSFQATYRNYYKLEVTSRILPGSEAPAP